MSANLVHLESVENIDPRAYPRIRMAEVTAQIVLPDRSRLEAKVHDISPDGMRITCHEDAALQIEALTGPAVGKRQTLFAKFALPVRSNPAELLTQCQTLYCARLPEDGVAIGMRFLKLVGSGKADLNQFLYQELETAGTE
jgi:hypothetical protein